MKKASLLSIICVVLPIHLSFSQILESDIIGQWPLSQNANDVSSNQNDGTVTGANIDNGAYRFNGTTDFVNLNSPASLDNLPLQDFSISVWIKDEETASNKWGSILSTYEYNSDRMGWVFRTSSDGQGSRQLTFQVFYDDGSNSHVYSEAGTISGDWQHLVVNFKSSVKRAELYINGSEVSYSSSQATFAGNGNYSVDNAVNKYIGRLRASAAGQTFKGLIKDLHIFNRALSSSEISDLGAPSTQESLWQSNEGNVFRLTGNVGIGTDNPLSKLAVDGQIISTEVKVQANIDVPDYVFEENYDLLSISETKKFILENKHLPEIPSAIEIEEEGILVGEMSLKLLKKIEEMTLHLIKQSEEIHELKNEIELLKAKEK